MCFNWLIKTRAVRSSQWQWRCCILDQSHSVYVAGFTRIFPRLSVSDRGDRVFPRLPHVMRVLIGLLRHSDLLRLFDYFGFMFFDDHLKTVLRTLTFNCCFIEWHQINQSFYFIIGYPSNRQGASPLINSLLRPFVWRSKFLSIIYFTLTGCLPTSQGHRHRYTKILDNE